jgi:DNA polymerase IV
VNVSDAPWERVIVHADMDAFFAAVEILDQPHLAQHPIAIGGKSPRSVVATANYLARQYGIHSAMPMALARKRCPGLVIVPPRMQRYREISRIVMAVFKEYAEIVQPLSLDEAFMDVSQNAENYSSPEAIGYAIKADVFAATQGLTVSVGISATKFVAKIASDYQKPNGLTVVHPAKVQAFLSPLPVNRLWGVGPKTTERVRSLGLNTIGDVATASDMVLRSLGKLGQQLQRLSQGVDHREVTPPGPPKSVGWERTLENDVSTVAEIAELLAPAAQGVADRLQGRGMLAEGVRVKLKTSTFELLTRQALLSAGTNQAPLLLTKATELLQAFDSGPSYRLVGLSAYDLYPESAGIQLELPVDPPRHPPPEN